MARQGPDDFPLRGEQAAAAVSAQAGGQSTERQARRILEAAGYRYPTKTERRHIAMAFAAADKVVYGKAFDAFTCPSLSDLEDPEQVSHHLDELTLFEVKTTNREALDDAFGGHFFSLTVAELLVAQSLKDRFKFLFVNTVTGVTQTWSIGELIPRISMLYPAWHIKLSKSPDLLAGA